MRSTVAKDGHTGLARSRKRNAMLREQLSGLLRYSAKRLTPRPKLGAARRAFSDAKRRSPCIAQKAGGLPSMANPARCMRRARLVGPIGRRGLWIQLRL